MSSRRSGSPALASGRARRAVPRNGSSRSTRTSNSSSTSLIDDPLKPSVTLLADDYTIEARVVDAERAIVETDKLLGTRVRRGPKTRRPSEIADPAAPDLVAFGAVEFACWEYDASIAVTVSRRGGLAERTTVRWATSNKSMHPDSYEAQGGHVVFEVGERSATITLRVNNETRWNPESIVLVKLSDCVNGVIGELNTASVVVLNDDRFPGGASARPQSALRFGLTPAPLSPGLESTDDAVQVLREFVRHLWYQFPEDSWKGIGYRTYPAVGFVVDQIVMMFALNAILERNMPVLVGMAGLYVERTLLLLLLLLLVLCTAATGLRYCCAPRYDCCAPRRDCCAPPAGVLRYSYPAATTTTTATVTTTNSPYSGTCSTSPSRTCATPGSAPSSSSGAPCERRAASSWRRCCS